MFKLQLMLYATLFFVFSFLISTATALSSLSISPSPFSLTNETIDVGQISISNTVASGGTGGYTGNWEWIHHLHLMCLRSIPSWQRFQVATH